MPIVKSPAFAGLSLQRLFLASSGRSLFFGAAAWPFGMNDAKLPKTRMAHGANWG